MKQRLLTVLLTVLSTAFAFGQTAITGTVTDAITGGALPGANVIIRSTSVGTATGRDGKFSLSAATLPVTLQVSSVGYATQNVAVTAENAGSLTVQLQETSILTDEVVVSASRVEESITKAAVTVEKLGSRQFANSPAATPFDALQNLKGVDLLTQSLSFKSVNIRGFGANNNNRFVQLTDGMDNRSPGLGFGFGNVAGVSDLDIESIEVIPGASSALYGPDALQGLMLTTSKNPFDYQGLSAQIKVGVNNVGKSGFGPKGYSDIAIRYARQLGNRFAFKVNFQRLAGTDFIADDYNDRSTSARSPFFATDASRGGVASGIAYQRNNDPARNFEYDGVNTYGDDINAGGAFRFPATFANAALQNKLVTRTGYTELDILGNNGKVENNRANASLYYKLTNTIQASIGWYYGGGNLIRTAGFREYIPDYQRHQFRAEVKGENFFVRAYTTRQNAEGWNIGQAAAIINNTWKPLGNGTTGWSGDFATAFATNGGNIGASRVAADAGRFLPGSAQFSTIRDALANTYTYQRIASLGRNGLRYKDNSIMNHYEAMYNPSRLLNNVVEVVVGGSFRRYVLNTGGTAVALNIVQNGTRRDTSEYTINEYGAYVQVSKELKIGSVFSIKPTVAVRYDKNQYFVGGFTPRASAVVSIGPHNFRGSWQSAFRNPSPGQLFAVPAAGAGGDVGGSRVAAERANLFANPAYLSNDVNDFTAGRLPADQLASRTYDPTRFTTEKIQTWEVGYKTLIANKLFVDAFLYQSKYSDFIAAQSFYQLLTPGPVSNLSNAANYRTLQVNFNNFNEIFVNGWGFGVDYALGQGFTVAGNYARQVGTITLRDAQGNVRKNRAGEDVIKRRMSDPDVAQLGRNFFISPENRYNITVANPKLTKQLGFAVTYRWTDKMWVEQGTTQGDVFLPAWNSLDAQVSYRVPTLKSVVKLGGSNILNQYYSQGYGLARIGGLYYLSITFDEFFR